MPYKDETEQRAAQKAHYVKNKSSYSSKVKQRRQERAVWWAGYKQEKKFKCKYCPEDHPGCISFHHTDPKEKKMSVADLVALGYSVTIILEEIEKCEVLCHNCHGKFHWENDFRRRNIV